MQLCVEIAMRTWTIVGLILTLAIAGCGNKNKDPLKVLPPPKHAPPPPPKQPMALDPALRASAKAQIEKSLASTDEIIRANAVEAAQESSIGNEERVDIISKLSDPSSVVRFAACMAVGQLKLSEAHQKLLELVDDPDKAVQIGARFALHRIGDTRYSHDLEQYARSLDPVVRGNTVMVLGLLGEKSGLKILRHLQSDPKPGIRLQVAEAMWRLGDEDALDTLVAATVSYYADDQIIGVTALAARNDLRVTEHIRAKLVGQFPEVGLAAARALGNMGLDDGYAVATKGAESVDPRQRALAALALGAIRRSDAQPVLRKLLAAPEEPVRLAAATAILQLKAN
jgi:HEAT repeat protein